MAQLVISLPAQADSIGIIRDLVQKAGVRVAGKYLAAFDKFYVQLVNYPESGALRPAVGHRVRICVVAPYTMIYEYDAAMDTMIVMRIVQGRRKITGEMLQADD